MDVDEFSAWLFAPSSAPWLDKKEGIKNDPCHYNYSEGIVRFDPMVRKLQGWQVCDRDGVVYRLGRISISALEPYAAMNVSDPKGGLARSS